MNFATPSSTMKSEFDRSSPNCISRLRPDLRVASVPSFRPHDSLLQNDVAVQPPLPRSHDGEALTRPRIERESLERGELELRPLALGDDRAELVEDRLLPFVRPHHLHTPAGVRNELVERHHAEDRIERAGRLDSIEPPPLRC